MKNPLALLLILAVTLPFIGCTGNQPPGRNTVFHRTEDSPRTGATQRSRYGANGTHSPRERSASRTRNNRSVPEDPDGIVKPRDLDPEVEDPDVVSTDPESDDPEKKDPETTDPDPAPASSGEPPYAEAVPGKYGLVYSPFVKKLVNVTDENDVPLPPGTEVTCPHTGKVFRVP